MKKTKRILINNSILSIVGRLEKRFLDYGIVEKPLSATNLIRFGLSLLILQHKSDKDVVTDIHQLKQQYNINDEDIAMSNDSSQLYRGVILTESEFKQIEHLLRLYVLTYGSTGNVARVTRSGYSNTELSLFALVALSFLETNIDTPKCQELLDNTAFHGYKKHFNTFISIYDLLDFTLSKLLVTHKDEVNENVSKMQEENKNRTKQKFNYFYVRATRYIDQKHPELQGEERERAIAEKYQKLMSGSRSRSKFYSQAEDFVDEHYPELDGESRQKAISEKIEELKGVAHQKFRVYLKEWQDERRDKIRVYQRKWQAKKRKQAKAEKTAKQV